MNEENKATEQGSVEGEWAEALAEQAASESGGAETADATPKKNYPKAEFDSFKSAPAKRSGETGNLEVILDIPVTVSVEIGRTRLSIKNLLQLNQGSIVELDRLAGEPMDLLVNGTLIAHGEVVVVNEKFGIRLTDVISAAERVKKLK